MSKSAIVLLSGGLDSATVLAMAQETFEVRALTFRYGQRHSVEFECAKAVAEAAKVALHVVDIAANTFANTSLLMGSEDHEIKVPKDRAVDEIAGEVSKGEVPSTYVPARNTLFLSYALAIAESQGAYDIFIGANELDYSGYPDCRPEFIEAFERLANVATATTEKIRIHAPLMNMNKAQIIVAGTALGVDYALTHSCYDPQRDLACGRCDSCVLRRAGFEGAKVVDPTRYV